MRFQKNVTCKFGSECGREMCMFRHEVIEEVIEKNNMAADQSDILEVNEDDENDIPNRTFDNPSQADKSSSDNLFRCEICDFASSMQDIIESHKELIHNTCTKCDSSFTTQKKLKNHIKNIHSDK